MCGNVPKKPWSSDDMWNDKLERKKESSQGRGNCNAIYDFVVTVPPSQAGDLCSYHNRARWRLRSGDMTSALPGSLQASKSSNKNNAY